MQRGPRDGHLLELGILGALLLYYHEALIWLVRTWFEPGYESIGFLPLLLVLPSLVRPPPRRASLSAPHLIGLTGLALVDLAAARLGLHVLSAGLALTSLHLWTFAFRRHEGAWFKHTQLWLGLLSLPAVYWANTIFGYPLQALATRIAASGLRLYGLPVHHQGTLLELPGATLAVDASCSGLKFLYTGALFGLLVTSGGRGWNRLLFFGALLPLLVGANVVRVMSLAMAQLRLGRPVSDTAHQSIGLLAFAMACTLGLLLWRAVSGRTRGRGMGSPAVPS